MKHKQTIRHVVVAGDMIVKNGAYYFPAKSVFFWYNFYFFLFYLKVIKIMQDRTENNYLLIVLRPFVLTNRFFVL